MPGPAALIAALLVPLQQLLEGAAAGCRMCAPGPLLLVGLGPVAGSARDFNHLRPPAAATRAAAHRARL